MVGTILTVDDSPARLASLAASLQEHGFDVSQATSGSEALAILAGRVVDCVLMEASLTGLSACETCARARSAPTLRDVPIIVVASLDDREATIRALQAGADDFVSTTSGVGVLTARIQAQIRRRRVEDTRRQSGEALLRDELQAAESRAADVLAAVRSELLEHLRRRDKELEALGYAVSHDLRAPVRSIEGFSAMLLDHWATELDGQAQDYLRRVRTSALRMGQLLDGLVALLRLSRTEIVRSRVDLSALARGVVTSLHAGEPGRAIDIHVEDGLLPHADRRLMQIVMENLLGNSWKFTRRASQPKVEVGCSRVDDRIAYFVRDNGVGFDMTYSERLFQPFQRFHSEAEGPGLGIGLALAHRSIDRHGGRISIESTVGLGTTVHFTLHPGAVFQS